MRAKKEGGATMAALKQEYEPQEWHQHLVPALDALIGNPDILTPDEGTEKKANVLYLPRYYVDRVNMFREEQSNRGESAKILLGSFSHILGKIHYSGGIDYVCKNGMTIKFMPEENASKYSSGGRIGAGAHALDVAKRIQANHGNEVAILTGDDYMASSAFINELDVAHINPDVYTGRRKLVLPEDLYGPWFDERLKERKHEITEEQFAEYFPNEPPLKLNEFVEFEVEYATASVYGFHPNCFTWLIGRFETVRGGEHVLRRIHYVDNLPYNIRPRTAGQAMYIEALMAPVDEIPIVIAPADFGTGKTFLATALGYSLVATEKPLYDRVFVVPRDSSLGKDIGFLPGDETQKTLAKAMPIVDNLEKYFKVRGDKLKGGKDPTPNDIKEQVNVAIAQHFEFVPIINMGGRSISDKWIIYDEAQDMERFQIDQLMKRIGDNSKMVIIGDPDQVFNPHMNRHSNGLMYAATHLAGSPYAAVVTMPKSEIVRSKAAREIARCFSHGHQF